MVGDELMFSNFLKSTLARLSTRNAPVRYSVPETHDRDEAKGALLALLPEPGKLTEDEAYDLDNGECPDCGSQEFYIGPEGGRSANIACATCGSRFNLILGMSSGTFGKDRLSFGKFTIRNRRKNGKT